MSVDTFEWAKIVEAFACNARIAGMQAFNAHWAALGQPPAYDEQHFLGEASTLDSIAGLLMERSR